MSKTAVADSTTNISGERIIDTVQGDSEGPTLVMLAGVHGNEAAGVQAVSEVLNTVRQLSNVKGKLIGVRGNMTAIKRNVRYVDEDMNRLWFPSIIRKIRETPDEKIESNERRELKHLMNLLVKLRRRSTPPFIIIDVHTFSSEGWMFALANRHPDLRELMSQLKVPKVYGLHKALHGTALGYFREKGVLSVGIEGGQHFAETTIYNLKAALMLLLVASECIKQEQVPEYDEYRDHLKKHLQHLPEETELVYQHIIEPGDRFQMRPGYNNFQPIHKGEWLADDQEGKIVAEIDGYMLMPLYQQQGNDGFFLIQEYEAE